MLIIESFVQGHDCQTSRFALRSARQNADDAKGPNGLEVIPGVGKAERRFFHMQANG
jgi:hypothetical protein